MVTVELEDNLEAEIMLSMHAHRNLRALKQGIARAALARCGSDTPPSWSTDKPQLDVFLDDVTEVLSLPNMSTVALRYMAVFTRLLGF